MKLSILIPTIQDHKKSLDQLLSILLPQTKDFEGDVHIDIEGDLKMNRGAKCNSLIKDAEGEYVWFLEDTDVISETAVSDIFEAIKKDPEMIGIYGATNVNGNVKDWYKPLCFNSPVKKDRVLKFKNQKNAEELWVKAMTKQSFKHIDIEKPIIRKNIGLTLVK